MTARIATLDDRIAAGVEEASAIPGESIIPGSASYKPQVDRVQFDCGYLSPHFVTNPERMEVAFENAYILIDENKISSQNDLLPLLEEITRSGKPLLIIAAEVGSEALAALVVNKLRGPLQVAAVRAPGVGDQRRVLLREIALLTGFKSITEGLDIQLDNIKISDLGQAKKITIDKNITIVEGNTKYEPRSVGSEPSRHPNAQTSSVQSSRTNIIQGTQETLSADPIRLSPSGHSDCEGIPPAQTP